MEVAKALRSMNIGLMFFALLHMATIIYLIFKRTAIINRTRTISSLEQKRFRHIIIVGAGFFLLTTANISGVIYYFNTQLSWRTFTVTVGYLLIDYGLFRMFGYHYWSWKTERNNAAEGGKF